MPLAARLGDLTAHGGRLAYGEPTVLIGGKPAARLGDPHICPMTAPTAHLGGMVISASPTVLINKSLAARVGDGCVCFCTGTLGVGLAPVVGPGAPPKRATTDAQGRMADEIDRVEPVSGPHAEAELTDSDQDGTRDTARARARGRRERTEDCVDLGPLPFRHFGPPGASELCARQETEVGNAEAEAKASAGDGGFGVRARAEVTSVEHEKKLSVGPSGDKNANPDLAVGVKGKGPSAEVDASLLLINDGSEIGVGACAIAEASLATGEVNGEVEVFSIFGYSLRVKAHAAGDLGDVGGGACGSIRYNVQTDRFHWSGMVDVGSLLGFEFGFDVSVGKDDVGILKGLAVTHPNFIMTGEPTVFIG